MITGIHIEMERSVAMAGLGFRLIRQRGSSSAARAGFALLLVLSAVLVASLIYGLRGLS